MGADFKWGIIGPGRIAHKFAEAVHQLNGASIYAIASKSTQEPDQLRHAFNAETCYDTYEALAADKAVDAIYVATPHRFHYDNVRVCLEARKPVLCEKSFTVNAAQAADLFSLSQEKHLFLMEALWTRFLPIYTIVREWLDAGQIGTVQHVYSTQGFVAKRDPADRLLNINLAGGTVLDLGVYNNAMAQWVLREDPRRIHAFGHIGETGVDETINVSYAYHSGASAQFTCTFEFDPRCELIIYGSEGRIIVHRLFGSAIEATLESGGKSEKARKRFKINGFEYQIIAAMDAIRDGRLDCPQMPQADTLAAMRSLDAIREQIGLRYPFE
jgi:predicted dehydrogenase